MGLSTRKGADVLVVGAGAIGLAAARAVARTGRHVIVLERGSPGREATHAAGGMLSPVAEARGPGPFLQLALDSFALWPDFAHRLVQQTGVALDLRLEGKLLVAFDEPDLDRLRARYRWLHAAGFAPLWLDGSALRARESALGGDTRAALDVAQDGQVDNRALARALTLAARSDGCDLRQLEARALLTGGGSVRGVRTADGRDIGADAVVLAAGAWSGTIQGLPRPLPVRPVKGQMVALAAAGSAPRTIVESESCYVIPRGADVVWVGATSEEVGFERGTTDEARAGLRAAAVRVLPALAHAVELERWDGLRPGTSDELPILGPDPDLHGLVYATGHYRNGILLTPVTAEIVVSAVAGVRDDRLAPFAPDRFRSV